LLGLKVEDRRGSNDIMSLILTDNGFKVTQYGNTIVDATELRKDGTISIKSGYCNLMEENNWGYHFKIRDY